MLTSMIFPILYLLKLMNLNICAIVCLLFFTTIAFAQNNSPTRLTYFIEHEQEQDDDYMQVSMLIRAQSTQLTQAISQAKRIVTEVAAIADQFCKQYNKKVKGDCKQATEIGNFQIEPKYQLVRKENIFTAFVVSHQVLINVYSPENVGILVDNILKYEDIIIKGFQWLPHQEKDSEQEAIREGVQQGENLCKQVGQTLGRIVDIQEVIDEEEQQKAGEQGQQEEDQPVVTTYKFEVECTEKTKTKK